jgi:hypothetical protein
MGAEDATQQARALQQALERSGWFDGAWLQDALYEWAESGMPVAEVRAWLAADVVRGCGVGQRDLVGGQRRLDRPAHPRHGPGDGRLAGLDIQPRACWELLWRSANRQVSMAWRRVMARRRPTGCCQVPICALTRASSRSSCAGSRPRIDWVCNSHSSGPYGQ